jgi:Ca2+-binding EF-hand superfamily protein
MRRTAALLMSLTLIGALRAAPEAAEEQDVLLLHDPRPRLLRLRMQADGRPLRAGWDDTVGQMFRYLDADGDGVLGKAEAARAPSPAQWLQILQGAREIEPDAAPDFGPAKVTADRLREVYLRAGAGPLQVYWGRVEPKADPLTDALFAQLDRNGDGRLTREELQAASEALAPLDGNDDEMLIPSELARGQGLPGYGLRPLAGSPLPGDFPLVPVATRPDLAAWLLRRYDRDRDGRLSREEAGLSAQEFARLGAGRDGRMDAGELGRWPDRLPPDLTAVIPLGKGGTGPRFEAPGRGLPPAEPAPDGSLRVALPGAWLELACLDGAAAGPQGLRQQYDRTFRAADRNKDGVVDGREAHQPPFALVGLLRLADRDGDGKLSRAELTAFLDLQDGLLVRYTYLAAIDGGRRLFPLLDADGDGRLSRRELRDAWKRLEPWAAGGLTRAQVPQRLRLVLSRGQPPPGTEGMPGGPGGGFVPGPAPARPSRGPLWFRKMDRNGDGDLSPREFLGTPEQFRRIDRDGDGLIDADEAARADQSFRHPSPPPKK